MELDLIGWQNAQASQEIDQLDLKDLMNLFKRYLYYVNHMVYDDYTKTWEFTPDTQLLKVMIAKENQARLEQVLYEHVWKYYIKEE